MCTHMSITTKAGLDILIGILECSQGLDLQRSKVTSTTKQETPGFRAASALIQHLGLAELQEEWSRCGVMVIDC
jgi:hypothetical protein